jgi:hypothetical protein
MNTYALTGFIILGILFLAGWMHDRNKRRLLPFLPAI